VASWFNRLQPLKGRAGLYLMTSAALLLLVSGSQALAEDEPAARAPLPPPLSGGPAEAGERHMSDPTPSRNQSDPRAPAIRFDRPNSQLSQKKPRPHSASYLGLSVGKKRETTARLGKHSMAAASRRQGHPTVISEKKAKAGPVAGRAFDRPAFPHARLSRSADREHHPAPSRAATISSPLLSQLLCRSARIWLRPELSVCVGTTRTGDLSVKVVPLQFRTQL